VLPLFVLVPFCCLLVLSLPLGPGSRRWAFPFALLVAALQVIAVLLPSLGLLNASGRPETLLGLGLAADNLTRVLLLSIGIVVFAAAAVGNSMLSGDRVRLNFATVVLLSLAGMNGAVLLQDVFSLYVFLEVTSVSSFILIASDRGRNSLEGAFKYLIASAVATFMMLLAVGLLLLIAGSTSFESVAAALKSNDKSLVAKIAMGAFACGLFIKGGLVPFHGWLPGAYSSAPASVSVLLAGIVTKVSGIYGLIRLVAYVFPPSQSLNEVLMLVGAVSIVIGALAALKQTDMKWIFAYSSISQIGYIVLALGCGTKLAIAAAILHLFNHSVFKTLLFVNAAAVEQSTGTTDMTRLGGIGSRMPYTNTTSVIGLLSTAGIPPLSGFWSKLFIIVALWQAQQYGYAVLAALLSVVTLGYLLIVQRHVFFGKTAEHLLGTREARTGVVFAAIVLAAITVAVGVLFPWIVGTFLFPPGGII
jgi:multicomponent Na+:H+ antiporter subunit D